MAQIDDSDPAMDLLKVYVDGVIKKEVGNVHKILQEQIKVAFKQSKDYIQQKLEVVQRDTQSQIDTSMQVLWQSIEQEMRQEIRRQLQLGRNKRKRDDDSDFIPDEEDEQDADASMGSVEEVVMEVGASEVLKSIADIEVEKWGKSFSTEKEAILPDDEEKSPSKKPKKAAPPKKQGEGGSKKRRGRPLGSENKTAPKGSVVTKNSELEKKNKDLEAQIAKLHKQLK